MKVGEVEIGAEYGALANPRAKGYYATRTRPRQVKAVEIVKQEERQYTGAWTPQKKVQIRRVKVELLDAPLDNASSWEPIESRAQGSFIVIEARQLIAPWADLAAGVKKGIEEKQAQDAAEAALDARIDKLFGKSLHRRSGGYCHGSVTRYSGELRESLRVDGTCVDQLLTWAEAGKAVS